MEDGSIFGLNGFQFPNIGELNVNYMEIYIHRKL